MKDPTRLLETDEVGHGASELELRLLRAGASEQPPAAALQRLAEQLGVSSAAKVHTASSQLRLLTANKLVLVAIGAVLVGSTLASIVWMNNHARELPAATAASSPHVDAQEGSPSPPPAAAAPPAADATDAPSLAREIAHIDSIRRLLAADRTRPALSALEEYERDFPRGVLHQEADVLRIEAHKRAGDKRRARVLAARFLADNPDSPHSAHVRELVHGLGPDAR